VSQMLSASAASWRTWTVPAGIITLALLVGTVHMTDETYLDLQGDSARYLMNGVFFLDVSHDASIAVRDFRGYAAQYYSRYPALSLGHHPILPSLLMAPVFGLFGISVPSARLVPLICFVAASVFLLLLVERVYDRRVSFVATLMFILSPFAASFSRSFLSEMPALAAMMAAVYFCERYSRSNRRLDLGLFIASAVISMYGKQLAACMLPVYALQIARRGGARQLLKAEVVAGAVAAAILLVPLALMTLELSPHNVRWVRAVATGSRNVDYLSVVIGAMAAQLSWPIVGLAALGSLRAAATRDRRGMLFLLWVAAFVGLVLGVTKDVEAERYTIYWVPALCTLAATAVTLWSSRTVRMAAVGVLVLSLAREGIAASYVHAAGAGGYEDVARYVVSKTDGEATVLFSGDLDTGYFVFFVRKHDRNRRLVVLRSDKILTTSYMANTGYKERVQEPGQIDPILAAFGTRFVVIEDRPSRSRVLDWLRIRVKRAPFVERLRVPLRTRDGRIKSVDLVVFENVGVPAANPETRMRLDLPVAGMVIEQRLGDVLGGPGRRK